MKAAIYARSAIKNDDLLVAQIDSCIEYLKRSPIPVQEYGCFSECCSSEVPLSERPAFSIILSLCRERTVKVIVVDELTRLTRSNKELFELISKLSEFGVQLLTVAEN